MLKMTTWLHLIYKFFAIVVVSVMDYGFPEWLVNTFLPPLLLLEFDFIDHCLALIESTEKLVIVDFGDFHFANLFIVSSEIQKRLPVLDKQSKTLFFSEEVRDFLLEILTRSCHFTPRLLILADYKVQFWHLGFHFAKIREIFM